MEPIIYKPGAYNTPGIYKGAGGIYKGRGVYKDGSSGGNTVVIGGRTYNTIKINGVTWLAENLELKGDWLTIGPAGDPNYPAAWYYDNNEPLYSLDGLRKCGLLYNGVAVRYMVANHQQLFDGWHVATDVEIDNLISFAGGPSYAGYNLKRGVDWGDNWYGVDEYGFGFLPGGRHITNFSLVESYGFLWSGTQINSNTNYQYTFYNTLNQVDKAPQSRYNGYSVRLVKD